MSKQLDLPDLEKLKKKKWDLVDSPIFVERVDIGGNRYYSPLDDVWEEMGEKGEKPLFKSITTISNRMDKGVGFHKWLGDYTSWDASKEFANLRGTIGTIVHIMITDLLLGDTIVFDDLALMEHPDLKDIQNVHLVYRKHKREIIKYVMSFKQFHAERDPAPLALEIPMMNLDRYDDFLGGGWKYPFAGTLDFVGSILKYNKPRFGYIDWKTGGTYPRPNALQAIAAKILWESHFPEHPLEFIASVYLKSGWLSTPKYEIKYYEFRPELWAITLLNDQTLNYLDKPKLTVGEWYQPNLPMELPTEITLEGKDENNS